VVVVLSQAHSLLLRVEPLDVDGTAGPRDDGVFELLNAFLCVTEGGKLDECGACEE